MIALLISIAQAGLVPVTVCVDTPTAFLDSDVFDGNIVDPALSGDIWGTNANRVLRGVKVEAERTDTGFVTYAWADATSYSAGCADLLLVEGEDYDFRVLSQAKVNLRNIGVYTHVGGNLKSATVASGRTIPVGGGTLYRTLPYHEKWQTLALAGLVLSRIDSSVPSGTYNLYMDASASPCLGSNCASDGDVYFAGTGPAYSYRFLAASLLGHAVHQHDAGIVSVQAQNYPGPGQPPDLEVGCGGGLVEPDMAHKQWQSRAISEGFARFIAASTFNDRTQLDCGYVFHLDEDYTGDGSNEFSAPNGISCIDGPRENPDVPLAAGVPTRDQLGHVCTGAYIPNSGTGTVLDWLRFFWDLETNDILDQGDLLNILEAAETDTWNIAGYDPTTNGDGDDPYERVRYNVFAPQQTAWDSRASIHGIKVGY